VTTHTELLDALSANLEEDNAFLVYADLVQEVYGEAEADRIRSVVERTAAALRGEDVGAKERARGRRQRVIHLGRERARRDAKDARREAFFDRAAALLSKPTSVGIPQAGVMQ
jgi:uncharacterized protein (TIGR02996 family)